MSARPTGALAFPRPRRFFNFSGSPGWLHWLVSDPTRAPRGPGGLTGPQAWPRASARRGGARCTVYTAACGAWLSEGAPAAHMHAAAEAIRVAARAVPEVGTSLSWTPNLAVCSAPWTRQPGGHAPGVPRASYFPYKRSFPEVYVHGPHFKAIIEPRRATRSEPWSERRCMHTARVAGCRPGGRFSARCETQGPQVPGSVPTRKSPTTLPTYLPTSRAQLEKTTTSRPVRGPWNLPACLPAVGMHRSSPLENVTTHLPHCAAQRKNDQVPTHFPPIGSDESDREARACRPPSKRQEQDPRKKEARTKKKR